MNPASRKVILAAVSLMIASQAPALAAKKASFSMPVQEKLNAGAGPTSAKPWEGKPSVEGQSLTPVGLNGDAPAGDNTGFLNASVSTSNFVGINGSRGTGADNGKSKSVVEGGLGSKVLKDAKKVDVLPLALMESQGEQDKKTETIADAEQRQLGDLWTSTISRNPDIQFVINKLQPSSNSNHAMANTMKFLSSALFGAMNVAPMMMGGPQGNPMAMMGMGTGASMVGSLFQNQEQKAAKKQMISQEQATILYKIVRDTAEKLVTSYRTYKKEITSVGRANGDFEDLKAMVAEAGNQDPAKQVEMQWTLRKAQREIEEKMEEARGRRQELVDLAGTDAVAKLDKEMDDEQIALKNIGPDNSPAPQTAGPFSAPSFFQKMDTVPNKSQTAGKDAGKTM